MSKSESIHLFKVLDTDANLDSKRSPGECLSACAWPKLDINLQMLPNFQMKNCLSVEIWAGVSMVASKREHFASQFLLLTVTLTIADSAPPPQCCLPSLLLGSISTGGQVILCCWGCLCAAGCLAASLALPTRCH